MPPPPTRSAVERAARSLVAELLASPPTEGLRVAHADGGLACLVLVWPAAERMPTLARRRGGERTTCRNDVLAVVRQAGRPVTSTRVAAALRGRHGAGTVVKALAELTRAGRLVNPRDRRGYRLPDWVGGPGTLFPDPPTEGGPAAPAIDPVA